MTSKSRTYTQEELDKAKELAEMLQDFSNRSLQCVVDHRVTDKTRSMVIAGILTNEFGDEIMPHVFKTLKMYGEPKFKVVQ